MPNAIAPTITIGADPELFVRSVVTGQIVSAHDLLPGTKDRPYKVPGGAIQVDGLAAEFNIEPAGEASTFEATNDLVISSLKQRLGSGYELVVDPVAYFEKSYFDTLPPNTKELGCNPDFNAWTGQVNDPPTAPKADKVMRTAAGHIHIGWTKKHDVTDPDVFADCCVVARQMDYYLGIWSLLWDPDPTRRLMYGKAGSMRVKPYGMEYRPLSNRWLLSPQLQRWVFNSAFQGVWALFNGAPLESKYENLAQKIIDENRTGWNTDPEMKALIRDMGLRTPPVPDAPVERPKKSKSGHSYGLAGADQMYFGNLVNANPIDTWPMVTGE